MTMYDQFDLFAQPEPAKSPAPLVVPVAVVASPELAIETTEVPSHADEETGTQLPAVIDDLEFLASTKDTLDQEGQDPQVLPDPEPITPEITTPAEQNQVDEIEKPKSGDEIPEEAATPASDSKVVDEAAEPVIKPDQTIADKPIAAKKATKAKAEAKDDDPDATEEPELLVIETMIDGDLFITQELIVGVPARRHGYLGKYRGRWISLLVDARAFARFSEEEKEAMRGRLKDSMLAPA